MRRRYSISDRDALGEIRPSRHSDWHRIRVLSGYLALAVVFVAVIFFLKHRHREDVERNWKCAMATIEDVQPKLVEQVNSARGGAMLYEVAILASYPSDEGEQRRWITVDQRPETLAEAELQTFRWKGQQCVVRWNRSMPDQVIAEVD
jgi:hypothetical protein